jgi:hypothetical protein
VANLTDLINSGVSRRKFLAGVGASAGAAAALNLSGCSGGNATTPVITPVPKPTPTSDEDVLNFALNLEYLEATFYLYAATGAGLQASDTTAGTASTYQSAGTVTVGSAAAVTGLTPAQQDILNEIAYEEQAHVRFLRSALGSIAVPMPDIDLSFFGPLAVAATITTAATGSGSFNPFDSFDDFLVGAFIFEDVGVTAYAGAAPLISAAGVTSGYLNAAAGILAVEAYHAGYIRTSLTGRAIAAGSASAYPYLGAANLVARLGRDFAYSACQLDHREFHRCRRRAPCGWLCPHRQPGASHRLRLANCGSRQRRLLPERHQQPPRHHHSLSGTNIPRTGELHGKSRDSTSG